jgi:5'-nucleotidase (lipoprotein e(P4) family)
MMNKTTITGKTFTPFKGLSKALVVFSAGLTMVACGPKQQPVSKVEAPQVSEEAMLANQLTMSVLWYQRAVERNLLSQQAYARAEMLLKENLKRYKNRKNPTVFMDIDETVLDNSKYEARLIHAGEQYDPESWNAWVMSASAPLVPGAQHFIELCGELGVEVFFISNRSVEHVDATAENLMRYDLPFAEPGHMLFKNETSNKTERRENVKPGRTIVLSVGDQLGDFMDVSTGEKYEDVPLVERAMSDTLMQHFVLLPNPMYGEFESDLYPDGKKLSASEKMRARKRALRLD